jgi:hypothetical protein
VSRAVARGDVVDPTRKPICEVVLLHGARAADTLTKLERVLALYPGPVPVEIYWVVPANVEPKEVLREASVARSINPSDSFAQALATELGADLATASVDLRAVAEGPLMKPWHRMLPSTHRWHDATGDVTPEESSADLERRHKRSIGLDSLLAGDAATDREFAAVAAADRVLWSTSTGQRGKPRKTVDEVLAELGPRIVEAEKRLGRAELRLEDVLGDRSTVSGLREAFRKTRLVWRGHLPSPRRTPT